MQALVKKDPIRRQVLRVKGCLAGSKAENLLEQGDMVLAINKEPVTCFQDVENACQVWESCDENEAKLNMTLFRQVNHSISSSATNYFKFILRDSVLYIIIICLVSRELRYQILFHS